MAGPRACSRPRHTDRCQGQGCGWSGDQARSFTKSSRVSRNPDQRSHTVLSANLNQLPAFSKGHVFPFPLNIRGSERAGQILTAMAAGSGFPCLHPPADVETPQWVTIPSPPRGSVTQGPAGHLRPWRSLAGSGYGSFPLYARLVPTKRVQ